MQLWPQRLPVKVGKFSSVAQWTCILQMQQNPNADIGNIFGTFTSATSWPYRARNACIL